MNPLACCRNRQRVASSLVYISLLIFSFSYFHSTYMHVCVCVSSLVYNACTDTCISLAFTSTVSCAWVAPTHCCRRLHTPFLILSQHSPELPCSECGHTYISTGTHAVQAVCDGLIFFYRIENAQILLGHVPPYPHPFRTQTWGYHVFKAKRTRRDLAIMPQPHTHTLAMSSSTVHADMLSSCIQPHTQIFFVREMNSQASCTRTSTYTSHPSTLQRILCPKTDSITLHADRALAQIRHTFIVLSFFTRDAFVIGGVLLTRIFTHTDTDEKVEHQSSMSAEMKVPPPDVKELFVPEDRLAER